MAQKLQVVQAFDRAVITEIPADDSQALETKLASADGISYRLNAVRGTAPIWLRRR